MTPSPSSDNDTFEHGFPEGFGAQKNHLFKKGASVAFLIAICFTAFQLITAYYPALPNQVIRSVHVGFLLLLSFALHANFKAKTNLSWISSWGLGIAGFTTGLYQWIEHDNLIQRGGDPTTIDLICGVVLIALVFEATRRILGAALPLMCGLCLAYAIWGNWLPAPLDHRGFALSQVIEHMSFGTEGIYGVPTYVSATYIFLFIIFGSFLERAGMIHLFTDVSLGLFGHLRGGPAKVAVFSSGLMGTISGSGVANVVTVGQFTIPLMMRFGYRPAFAAGVEATASMGGQIMPPVMGAAAFIMAETLGVSYSEIVKAALIPAILYFCSAYWMVHLEAGKYGLQGLEKSTLPKAWSALKKRWYLAVPLAALIILLFHGYTPLHAGTVGLALTVILIFSASVSLNLPTVFLRSLFWIFLGIISATAFHPKGGTIVMIGVVILLSVILWIMRGGRETLRLTRETLATSAKTALPVGLACAIVGIIIGTMTLTGVGTRLGNFIVELGHTSLFLSLILTMILSIILGTGIPTIPTYIIVAALASPALATLGVPMIIAHMFAFYFGIMADLSPPVALAALAASPIAKENPDKIGWEAMRVALAGYVIPFVAVYSPALMLQSGDPMEPILGFWGAVIYATLKCCMAIGLFGIVAIGYLFAPISLLIRILLTGAAILLLGEFPGSDAIGAAIATGLIIYEKLKHDRMKQQEQ